MVVYTDGACVPNPGSGGWSYVLVQGDEIVSFNSGFEPNTTNNRMEYLALIKAIENHGGEIESIFTDSMLLVNTCNKWRHSWKSKGWRRRVKNLDLVQRIDALLETYEDIEINWVRGHNGDPFNEAADELATNAALKR